MAKKKDTNELAKYIVDIATGEIEPPKQDEGKNPAAVALGRLGGLKGGKARAERMSKEQRKEVAVNAANTRWQNAKKKG